MPDDPKGEQGAGESREDLDAEVADFQAELNKILRGESPREAEVEPVVDPEEALRAGLPSKEEIEARLAAKIKQAEEYLGPVRADEDACDEEEPIFQGPQVASKFDGIDQEFRDRLQTFDKRSRVSKLSRDETAQKKRKFANAERDSARGLGAGLTVAYTIIGVPLLGALVGYLIDESMGTKTWTGVGVAGGAILGVVMGIMILNRLNQNEK